MQFRRELTFVEMEKRPQVVISSFALADNPKKLGRIAHLKHLLSLGSEHIVLIERASDTHWDVMSEARSFLLSQSTEESPLHVTAPCPHDGACPRAKGKEACTFAQRLQRPLFLRKTKHGKRGEETVAYTYLVISRGQRPVAGSIYSDVGRMGAVGKENVQRLLAKESGRSELQEVEGGEHGNYEVVNVATQVPPIDTAAPNDPTVQSQLREEAYAWPRQVAPSMKRSGHVVMDLCAADGQIKRIRVARSHGKQEYYDARKSGWGDLYPHRPKGKEEIRDRGVRRLTKVDHSKDEEQIDEILKAVNSSPLEHETDDFEIHFEDASENAGSNPVAGELSDDVDLEAVLRSLGKKMPTAEWEAVEDGREEAEDMLKDFGTSEKPRKKREESYSRKGRAVADAKRAARFEARRGFSTSARRSSAEDLAEDCAIGEGGFSRSSLSDPPMDRPMTTPYVSTRPRRPAATPEAEPAAAGEGTFPAWSLSDPPHRGEVSRSASETQTVDEIDEECAFGEGGFSSYSLSDPPTDRPIDRPSSRSQRAFTSAMSEPSFRGEEGYVSARARQEEVDEECALGEGGFSRSSLSDPEDGRPIDKPYVSTRPKRPSQPVARNEDDIDEECAFGDGGFSRSSLSDPLDDHSTSKPYESSRPKRPEPVRANEDDIDEECAFGDGGFSQSSLSDPLDLPIRKPHVSVRPKRSESLRARDEDDIDEDCAIGEGGFTQFSLSDPPHRSTSTFSTPTRPRVPQPTVSNTRFMSVAPAERTSVTSRPKLNVGALRSIYDSGTPITVLTAYDFPTASLAARAGIDMILVGDSLAQVALGYPSTVPLTIEEMAHHVRAVARGAGGSFILVDLPFGYAEASVPDGVKAAVSLMKAGADGIKIEGGREMLPLVRRLSETGIPVMSHIGLQPQRVASMGYKAQGRNAAAAIDLVATAKECEAAGAFSLLLEAIPHAVATAVTQRTSIPTIGIGAGNGCSGQVLVITDMLATYDIANVGEQNTFKVPKFVRLFGNVGRESRNALDEYVEAVRSRDFPTTGAETYAMPKDEREQFLKALEEEKE